MENILLFIIIPGIIVLCCITGKKKKRKKTIAKYTTRIKELTEAVKSSHAFEIVYDSHLKDIIPNSFINKETPPDISIFNDFKNEYRELIISISNVSKDNTVFFTSPEEWDNFEKLHPNFADQINIISQDIKNTLPLLAKYVLMHKALNKFYIDICIKLLDVYNSLLGGLDHISDEDDGSDEYRKNQEYLDTVLATVVEMRRVSIWDIIIKEIPLSDKYSRDIFEDIYNNNRDLRVEWNSVYQKGMKNAMDKRGYVDFFGHYLDFSTDENREKEIKDSAWYHCLQLSGHLSQYSSIGEIKRSSYNEYMRVHALYESGQMKGRYSTLRDPEATAD